MSAEQLKRLERLVLIEILAAFAVCMVTLIICAQAGRFNQPPGVWLCNKANECHREMS